jgi:hypothetical protein
VPTNKGFIYSFWDENNNLLYIGKTEGALLDRLRTHSHCEKKVYEKTTIIKFFSCPNPIVLDVVEKLLIGQLSPSYNIRDTYDADVIAEFVNTTNFSFQYEWKDLPREVFHFQGCTLSEEEIRRRQIEGIKRAKAEGKYKGRKPQTEKKRQFVELLPLNLAGERTATSIFKELEISSCTFYRWKKEYEEKGEMFGNAK